MMLPCCRRHVADAAAQVVADMMPLLTLGFESQIPAECRESLRLDTTATAQDQDSAVMLRHRRCCYRNRRLKLKLKLPFAEAEQIAAADDAHRAVVAAETKKADDNGRRPQALALPALSLSVKLKGFLLLLLSQHCLCRCS
jgi:hypothetical protein